MPKVLAVGLEDSSLNDGGLNRYFIELTSALRGLGVPVACLVTGDARRVPGAAIEVVASSKASLGVRLRAILLAARRHVDIDVVDAHFALTALPLLLGPLRHRPLVVHFQGPWADESAWAGQGRLICAVKRRVERVVYHRADAFVVLSRSFRRVLVERYGVRPWDVHVRAPGVDLDHFRPGDAMLGRAALGLPPDAFVVVAVRRLVPRMGVDILLRAWTEVIPAIKTAGVLCIVGTGPELLSVEKLGRELGLGDSLRFAGRVDDEDLVRYYQSANVSVVPSVALEGFGLVVLESLATGTPVVASDVDGLSESLDGLATNLLVPSQNPKALADRLLGAFAESDPLPSTEECRRYAEGFSWPEVARWHKDLYLRIGTPSEGRGAAERRELRVVIVGHTAQLSGGELAIARELSAIRDCQVHAILAQDGPLVSVLERSGVSVEVRPMGQRTRDLRKDRIRPSALPVMAGVQSAIYVFQLAWRLRRLQPDLVHTNTLKAALYGGLAARLAGIPCVWHVRDRIASDYLPNAAVRIVRAAARILPTFVIANSDVTLGSLQLPKGSPRRHRVGDFTAVIPSPVVIPPMEYRPRSSVSLRVAMVGRIAPWKGQDVFLRAFAKAFPAGDEIAVLVGAALFGEDEFETQLRDLVEDLGIHARVEFRGFRADVFDELSRVDVLVHASILPEPFGQVVLEGMAAGLPVVATRAGGPEEILDEGETGLLYSPGDVDALATLLRRLADNPEQRSRLGSRAREAAAMYSPARVADQIRDAYDRALQRSTSAWTAL